MVGFPTNGILSPHFVYSPHWDAAGEALLHPRVLERLLLLASESHNDTSAADALKASRASVVRWLAAARSFSAVVNWNRTRRRFEVAPETEREIRRRLELLTSPFPPA